MKTAAIIRQITKAGRRCQRLAVMIALLMLCLGGSAMGMGLDLGGGEESAPPPDNMSNVERLAPLSRYITSPTDVALDQEGRVYIADSYAGRVVVLSSGGSLLRSVSGLAQPVSVAVDAGGRIYVGNNNSGNVAVFDPDGNLLFKLGKGDGEFSQPNDIAIDPAGNVYVVDKWKHAVGIYSSVNGVLIGALGEQGTGDGQFYRPLSIAIDAAAREIVVLDSAGGARVQFFDLNRNYRRSFSNYGEEAGQLLWPQRITTDSRSRIYVSDSQLNMVLVYENNGDYIGFVNDLVDDLFMIPMGLAAGAANKLYIASHTTGTVEVYGLYEEGVYGYVGMEIDPSVLSFEAEEGGENPARQAITVTNIGNMSLHWQAAADESWISLSGLSHSNGIVMPGKENRLHVKVNKTGLEPGVHKGSILFIGDTGMQEVVDVALTIHPSSIVSVMPGSLSFVSEVGTTPVPQYFTVANGGSATLSWNAAASHPWISMSTVSGIIAGSGSGGDKVTVLADVTSLAAGTYTGVITVTGLDAFASPAAIEVTLTLLAPPGGGEGPTPEDRMFDEMAWTLGDKLPSADLNGVWTDAGSPQVFAVGQDGMILHHDGTDWSFMDANTEEDLFGVWGSIDPDSNGVDVFAVGSGGVIVHYDGIDWNVMASLGTDLQGVWGFSPLDVYAVGQHGVIFHYNGANWTEMESPTNNDLHGIWGIFDAGTNNIAIYVVGERGTIASYDGARWRTVKSATKNDLYGVWGSSRFEVYAVGRDGIVLKSGAKKWNKVDSPTTRHLKGIWGTSFSDIYAVGSAGTIIHHDGQGWSAMNSPTVKDLNCVWGSWQTGVFAAGQDLTLLYHDGGKWQSLVAALEGLNSVWGRSASDVYAVGMLGTILHYDGYEWDAMDSPVTTTLNSIRGGRITDIFAVGTGGAILRYNGLDWDAMASPTSRTLYDVWGAAQAEMYAVGQRGTFLNYDGTGWASIKNKVKEDLYSVWGRSADDVYLVGQGGIMLHYDGIAMRSMASPTTNDLYSVRGCSETSVFVVGQGGTFLQYNGLGWRFLESATGSNLYGLWCSSETDVFAVGQDDTFIYYDGNSVQVVDFGSDSSLKSVWGSMETTDIFTVGSDGIIIHGTNE
ncbi:MAG: 6-bladed beta-propeller [Desulfobulbaceae bacterium]|nr:6-bladed beta-propeller [Desulfobulbaceae bacterium]